MPCNRHPTNPQSGVANKERVTCGERDTLFTRGIVSMSHSDGTLSQTDAQLGKGFTAGRKNTKSDIIYIPSHLWVQKNVDFKLTGIFTIYHA